MDGNRRRFLALFLGGAALCALGPAVAAENAPATPAGQVVHLTLAVEGMH
jgi:hypothetical protein